MTTLLTSIYLMLASSILLCYKLRNLQACPLPANASCSECQVIREIQGLNEPNVNLNIIINLFHALNNPNDFIHAIERPGLMFDTSSINSSLETCLHSRDPNVGTPCTHNLQMVGDPLLTCRWNYTCDYSPNRFPQYLWRAQCPDNAQQVFYRIPVLTVTPESEGDCLPFTNTRTVYRWEMEMVAVACTCNTT